MPNSNNADLGIEILPVKDVEEFRAVASKIFIDRDPWEMGFRGQEKASWELKPSLFRHLEKIDYDENRFSLKKATNVLEKYYRESLIGNSDIAQDTIKTMDIWHLGQHYGLTTPQLDWSYSPWVALYFAMEQPTKEDQDLAAVWVLDMGILNFINDAIRMEIWPKKGYLSIGGETVDNYPTMDVQILNDENNRRLSNQQGFFTKHEYYHTFEVWLTQTFKKLNWDMEQTEGPLKKITIPRSAVNRSKILRELQLMNITPGTLFPDIWGSSKEAMYKLEQYITASHKRSYSVRRKNKK